MTTPHAEPNPDRVTPDFWIKNVMIYFVIMLGLAACFFGMCFINLAGRVYDFIVGIGPAADLNFVEYVILLLGTMLAATLSSGCAIGALILIS